GVDPGVDSAAGSCAARTAGASRTKKARMQTHLFTVHFQVKTGRARILVCRPWQHDTADWPGVRSLPPRYAAKWSPRSQRNPAVRLSTPCGSRAAKTFPRISLRNLDAGQSEMAPR